MKNISPQVKITFIYIAFGVLWIFFSDRLLQTLISDAQTISQLQTAKGWAYVVITAFLLYSLIKKDYKKLQDKETEKQKIFNTTLRVVHHILNNFLNGMLLVKMEAEKSKDFDANVLHLYDRAIKDAQTQIKDLGAVSDLTEAKIKKSVDMV